MVICSRTLYNRIGYSFLLMPVFLFSKMYFERATRRWREQSWIFQHKVSDKRSNELDMSLRNVKSVKLYSW